MISYGKMEPYREPDKTGLFIRGHAHYAPKGEDIVCAAVSAIGQTAAQGCKAYDAKTEIRHCADGHVVFICDKRPETEAIIRAALIGLDSVKEIQPQCFTHSERK